MQYTGRRAGVGQASREETAACAAVVREGYDAMAIVASAVVVLATMEPTEWATNSMRCRPRRKTRAVEGRCVEAQGVGSQRQAKGDRAGSGDEEPADCLRAGRWWPSWQVSRRRWCADGIAAQEGLQNDHRGAAVQADEGRLDGVLVGNSCG